MNSGPTSERVYGALRERILANVFAPGARLDPAVLASELASSVTPVRDALHLLAGEQLVEVRPGDLIHADLHGVCIIPPEVAHRVADACAEVERAERPLLEVCRSADFTLEEFLARRARFDEDLWAIELDIADPERFIAETTAQG